MTTKNKAMSIFKSISCNINKFFAYLKPSITVKESCACKELNEKVDYLTRSNQTLIDSKNKMSKRLNDEVKRNGVIEERLETFSVVFELMIPYITDKHQKHRIEVLLGLSV